MFATNWVMTVFSQKLPLSLVLRIFDVFLAEGLRMIYRISMAIIHISADTLLQVRRRLRDLCAAPLRG
eukprot:SAG31_NODE_1073_length_10065_cov_2.176701_10_plen_68_part_00